MVGVWTDMAGTSDEDRYLVDEGFLAREAGVSWRVGGRVDV
jgi:hypothetical protein